MKQHQPLPMCIHSTMPAAEQMTLAEEIIQSLRKHINENQFNDAISALQTGIAVISDQKAHDYILSNAVTILTSTGNIIAKCAAECKDINTKIRFLKQATQVYKLATHYYAHLDKLSHAASCHLSLLLLYDSLIQVCEPKEAEEYREELLEDAGPLLRYYANDTDTTKCDTLAKLVKRNSIKPDIKINFAEVLSNGKAVLTKYHANPKSVSTEELQQGKLSLETAISAIEDDGMEILKSCCYQLVKFNYSLAMRLDDDSNGFEHLNIAISLMRYVDFGNDERTLELTRATCNLMRGFVFFERNNDRKASRTYFQKAHSIFARYGLQHHIDEIKKKFPDIDKADESEQNQFSFK